MYTTCSKVFVRPSFCISFSVSTNSHKNPYNDTKQHEMNQQEIKEIIDDIISEVKESK